jgi:prepilin-type N-terminal cleavage/methylation domain-containing protein
MNSGFTLIEVLVAMLLIAITASFSMTVSRVAAVKQSESKDIINSIYASKSIKNAFNEYLYSVSFDSLPDGLVATKIGSYNGPGSCLGFPTSSFGEQKLAKTLCEIEEALSSENSEFDVKENYKRIFLTITKKTSNNMQYFTNRVRITPANNTSTVLFDRMFTNQIALGVI